MSSPAQIRSLGLARSLLMIALLMPIFKLLLDEATFPYQKTFVVIFLFFFFSDQCGASKNLSLQETNRFEGLVTSCLYHFRGEAGIADNFCFCTISLSGQSTASKSLNLTCMRCQQITVQETCPDTCVVSGDLLESEYSKYSSAAAVTIELPQRERWLNTFLHNLSMHVINLTG